MNNHRKSMGILCFLLVIAAFFGCGLSVKADIVDTSHQKYSYEELSTDLAQLQAAYPNQCQLNVIGQSLDGRNLYEVVIGNPNASKHLLVIANLHAREYMTTQLCMKQIEYYLANYNGTIMGCNVAAILDKVCIHYVPSCNPDGTAISQYGLKSIRNLALRKALKKMKGKTATWKANARGVDLNRNWDVAYRKAGKASASGYHGTCAASEPETQAIVNWVNNVQARGTVVGVISYHSTGSILFGRCVKSANAAVKSVTSSMASIAQSHTGYRLMPVQSISSSNSCSREYFLYVRNIPCITLEVGKGSCPLKIREFSAIWRKNKDLVFNEAMLFY